jgi:hypothetical protein
MKERLQRKPNAQQKVNAKEPQGSKKERMPGNDWQQEMFRMSKAGSQLVNTGNIWRGEMVSMTRGNGNVGEVKDEKAPARVEAGPKAEAPAKAESPAKVEAGPKTEEEKKPSVKPAITHETLLNAKEGGKVRQRVGVGEKVLFKGNKVGDWEASTGSPYILAGSKEFIWTAPNRADSATIKFTVGGESTTVTMTVVEPEDIVTTRRSRMAFPMRVAAVGMTLHFDYKPFDVSFGRVEAGEKSGPVHEVKGYFTKYAPGFLYHDSKDKFFAIQEDNRLSEPDNAASFGHLPIYKYGHFHWIIPNRFRVKGEAGNGKEFKDVRQSFFINAAGGMSVRKGGVEAHRGFFE